MEVWTKWCIANQPTARTTAKWRLRDYRYSNWRTFEIRICGSSFHSHGNKHKKSQYRNHGKTRFFTHTRQNRQEKRFRLPSYTRSSGNTKHKFEASHNKTCTNVSGSWSGPMPQSRQFRKSHRANTGNNGTNVHPLQPSSTSPSTIPVFPVIPIHQAQHFLTEFHITSNITNWVCDSIPISHLLRIYRWMNPQNRKAVWQNQENRHAVSLTSNTKNITTKKAKAKPSKVKD